MTDGGTTRVPVFLARSASAKRAIWTTLDQVVSSLANAALSIFTARAVSTDAFGTFALSFSVFVFMTGFSQAVNGQVLIIRYSGASHDARQQATAAAVTTAGFAGVVGGGLFVLLLLLSAPPALGVGIVVAICLPALLVQDTWRSALMAASRPRAALVNDGLWAVLQFSAIAVLIETHQTSGLAYALAWGVSAYVAAIFGFAQLGFAPSRKGTARWLRTHVDLSRNLGTQWLSVLGTTQLALFLLAGLGGVSVVGSIRASQTLLGPLNLVGMSVTAFVVPELIRRRPGRRALRLVALAVSAGILVVNLLWGFVLLLLPSGAGMQLLGATWSTARLSLPGMVLFAAAIGVTTGPMLLFRALDLTRNLSTLGLVLGPLLLISAVTGEIVGGVSGAAWGFAFASTMVVPIAFALSRTVLRSLPYAR